MTSAVAMTQLAWVEVHCQNRRSWLNAAAVGNGCLPLADILDLNYFCLTIKPLKKTLETPSSYSSRETGHIHR